MKVPQNHTLERALIGELFDDPSRIGLVVNELEENDFFNPQHRRLYQCIVDQWASGRAVDHSTVSHALDCHPERDTTDVDCLHQAIQAAHNPAGAVDHAKILHDLGTRRQLIQACNEAQYLAAQTTDGSITQATTTLQHACLSSLGLQKEQWSHHLPAMVRQQANVIRQVDSNNPTKGVLTGFYGVDRVTGGLFPTEIAVVCGPSGMGKTAFALNMCWNVARNHHVLLFSQEMSWEQIANRAISHFSGVPLVRLRRRELYPGEDVAIQDAISATRDLKMGVIDAANLSPMDAYTRAVAWSVSTGESPALIVVDYLQLMRPNERQQSREREVGSMITSLKSYAKLLQCPVVVVSQLSRPSKEQRGKYWEPTLWDLRDSGQIEQDAHVIMAVVRPSYFGDKHSQEAKLLILKNRDGETGAGPLRWYSRTASFYNEGDGPK